MQIDWWTLALQTVNFLVLVWLLQRFLYRPVRDVLEKRRALSERAFTEAKQAKADAETEHRKLENQRKELAEERQELLKRLHEENEAERNQLIEKARSNADALIAEARGTIAQEREEAIQEIKVKAAALASEMAAQILKTSGVDTTDEALDRLERSLRNLSVQDMERLTRSLSGPEKSLTVTTARTLEPESEARWRKQIASILGPDASIRFDTDPAILGGAVLHFPNAIVSVGWADQLDRANEAINRHDDAS